MEDTWLREKTRTLIWALAEIAEYINGLPNYREEDEYGIPTRESWLASALHSAVNTATLILAYVADVKWQDSDRDRILRHGQVGLQQLLVNYGLVTLRENYPLPEIDHFSPKLLGMLDALKDTWTFAHFDVTRPLQGPVIWEDSVVDEDQQRELLRQAFEKTTRYAAQPQGWLLISGPYGAGKSHLASAIIRQASESGVTSLYLSARAIAYRYRSPNDPEWLTDQPRLEAAALLILDDLFLDERILWNKYIENLLRLRRDRHRPTVLISTRSQEHLPAWLRDIVIEVPLIVSDYLRLTLM